MTPETFLRRIPAVEGRTFPDDASWLAASVLELVRAQDGRDAEFATAVRLLDDGRTLFVRFDCDDPDIWSTHVVRDAPLWEEEVVEVFLAPGERVPARYVEVEVNPLGTIFDARVTNPDGRRETMTVDASWNARGLAARVTRPAAGAWRADIALPWSEATAGEPPSVWRANFFRIERPRGGTSEFSCWSPTRVDPPDFHKPSAFGRLVRAGAAGSR
jgi:hypothetical protein